MLALWRRHEIDCPHKKHGRSAVKCQCPIWCDGEIGGRRIRHSLKTRDWARAGRRLAELEERLNKEALGEAPKKRQRLKDATAAFLGQCQIGSSTEKKYKRVMNFLVEFGEARGVDYLDQWKLAVLDEYKQTRPLCPLSWQKELQLLRTFFEFCLDREWIERNPAKKMRMPPDPKPKPRQPYTRA